MQFLVGLMCGGLMEDPGLRVESPYQVIEADTAEQAAKEYNKKNNCSYFYGHTFAKKDPEWTLISKYVSQYQLECIVYEMNEEAKRKEYAEQHKNDPPCAACSDEESAQDTYNALATGIRRVCGYMSNDKIHADN